MLNDYINRYFITLFLIAGFTTKLTMQRRFRDVNLRYFFIPTVCAALLTLVDFLGGMAALDPAQASRHTLFLALGLSLRPIAALGVALVVAKPDRRTAWLCAPALLNAAASFIALISPVAFRYDARYNHVSGPLELCTFAVSVFYLAVIIVSTCRKYREGHMGEVRTLVLCALCCLVAALLDIAYDGAHLNSAMLISTIFYYMFIYQQDAEHDPLTGLRNRRAFYADCKHYDHWISAVATIDMNGLKQLNDSNGHDAGDAGLRAIGKAISAVCAEGILGYRTGGDEFTLLFVRQEKEEVLRALHRIRTDVAGAGYSVATGFAIRNHGEALPQLVKLSDEQMYADKAGHYARARGE